MSDAGDGAFHQAEAYRLLVEGVKDYAIFMLDPTGRIATWNLGAERIKGYKAEEAIGRHFSLFYTDEDINRGHPQRELEIATAEGRYEEEGWRVRKDGTRFWANVVITALRDEAGCLRGFAKVTRDITERKRLEQELRDRLAELAETDRRKDEFLAMLAHELRNPLAAINNAVQLTAHAGVQEQIEWSMEVISHQIKHLARLVDDLLDVSRITRGRILLRKERVDAASIIGRAIEAVKPAIEERTHELAVSVSPGEFWVEADPTRL